MSPALTPVLPHASRCPGGLRQNGFTLVELLVVIGIIALLISVLMPALTAARQQAQKTQCLSNLRSLGQAVALYQAEHKGVYPPLIGAIEGDPMFHLETVSADHLGEVRVYAFLPGFGPREPVASR